MVCAILIAASKCRLITLHATRSSGMAMFTESGIYEWVGVNVAGCDSTVLLNLTIEPSYEVLEEPVEL